MKGKGFLIGLLIFIIVGASSGYLVYHFVFRDGGNNNDDDDDGSDIVCVEYPFTHYPVNLTRIYSITPLGNLNPPGHTFPTDHMYFYPDNFNYSDGFEIFIPGNMTINSISMIVRDPPWPGVSADFSLRFTVCEHLTGTFGHINNLSDAILDLIGPFGEEYGDYVDSWEVAGATYTSYEKGLDLAVEGGMLLGRAGYFGAYDFWLKDDRVTDFWVNETWSQEFQHTVSPLAYYDEPHRSVMESMLGYGSTPTDPPNYHGRIAFDVADTAQGIWLWDDWTIRREDNGLSLVYDNHNASRGAISIGYSGNSSWDSQVYLFNPTDSGFMNRNFSQVTNNGNVYYYYCDLFSIGGGQYDKVILIKMDGNRALYLQFIDQNGTPLPADPTILFDEDLARHYSR